MPTTSYLANSPAEIAAQLLMDIGVGSDPGPIGSPPPSAWPVYNTGIPDQAGIPDKAIGVEDTTGQSDGRSMIDGELFCHYGLKFTVRSSLPNEGFVRADMLRASIAQNVYKALVGIGASRYLVWGIAKIGQVLPLGRETPTSRRNFFTINAIMSVRQTS